MTIDEFNETLWTVGMRGRYKDGIIYPIATCDFDEALIGLDGVVSGSDDPMMVRCENVDIVSEDTP